MQLISITLKNIRSYTDARIEFPTGTVMLSGDIGSGKSTILLSIEFALFGLMRGELSGKALLRNGAEEGSVELAFKTDNNYTIKRTLKRTKKSVEQEAGYLLVNGVKKDATATELKSKILEILSYPKEMLTKSKNFVYRYTVYTPQEEMKRILGDDSTERVATLRKIFGMDRYEKIVQNADGYAKLLRERQRAFDAMTAGLHDKKKQLEETRKEHNEILQESAIIEPIAAEKRKNLAKTKQKLLEIEQQKTIAENTARELQIIRNMLESHKENHLRVMQEISETSKRLENAKEEQTADINEILRKSKETNSGISEKEIMFRSANMKIAELTAIKKQSAGNVQKITGVEKCPMCLQQISHTHKHQILSAEKERTEQADVELAQHNKIAEKTEQEIVLLKQQAENLKEEEKKAIIAEMKKQNAQELARRKNTLEEQKKEIEEKAIIAKEKAMLLEKQKTGIEEISIAYAQARMEMEKTTEEERELSIKHSVLLQKQKQAERIAEMLEKEVAEKENSGKQLEKTQKLHHWLTEYFTPLMGAIEKHAMTKIHYEFNSMFQQWFGMLVEEEISARLDESFTPIIQQNGYDVEVENLSGGERTACALAYRLALNKTINTLISGMKTKELLMLDEPTEGFSSEQLDRMREVLQQLKLNQIIIVSHEQKIESFADNIIRICKEDHVSRVV